MVGSARSLWYEALYARSLCEFTMQGQGKVTMTEVQDHYHAGKVGDRQKSHSPGFWVSEDNKSRR